MPVGSLLNKSKKDKCYAPYAMRSTIFLCVLVTLREVIRIKLL